MNIPKISKRLEAAASFSRRGARVADVGTDHAYLPIYLCAKGMAHTCVASDINEGPVLRARANVCAYGAEKQINVVRTDGLSEIDAYSPEDIYILGMGGDLICRIIDRAPFVKSSDIRLVLQPMTHPETLRRYLFEHGFVIVDECIVRDDKLYQIICAQYTGESFECSADECTLLFGEHNIECGGELLCELLERYHKVYTERLLGKARAGESIDAEREMLLGIEKIRKDRFSEE